MEVTFPCRTALIILGVFFGILLILAIIVIGMYNQLVTLRNRYKNAFSQIDVQLKRRYDLIPNLVEVAKGYMKHERETLEAVIKARNVGLLRRTEGRAEPGRSAGHGRPERRGRPIDRRARPASWPFPRPIPT